VMNLMPSISPSSWIRTTFVWVTCLGEELIQAWADRAPRDDAPAWMGVTR
jgi:hypothetical protein